MNGGWMDFLKSKNAKFSENSEIFFLESSEDTEHTIATITHLAIIKVMGEDASRFLQGQLTCNINDLTDSNSFFAAFCNAKGRTISTLLILKKEEAYFLILPAELIDKVINKLKMYILRSDVQLTNATNNLCLTGITSSELNLSISFPETDFAVKNGSEIIIKFPSTDNRYLCINSVSQGKALWTQLTQKDNFLASNSSTWNYQDISIGLPWLTELTSEEYIPQMLNIDKLGGISFEKGCYTGQEVIARTHYLGKAKRELFLAECSTSALLESNTHIISDDGEQTIGKVISFQANNHKCRILIVAASTGIELKNLMLHNSKQDGIKIIDFQ